MIHRKSKPAYLCLHSLNFLLNISSEGTFSAALDVYKLMSN